MRRIVPLLAALVLLLPALAVPASAEYVNHVLAIKDHASASGGQSTYFNYYFNNTITIHDISIKLRIKYFGYKSDDKIIFYLIKSDGNKIDWIYIAKTRQIRLYNSSTIGTIQESVWYRLSMSNENGTQIWRIGTTQYVTNMTEFPDIKGIKLYIYRYSTASSRIEFYIDDLVVNGQLMLDWEDAQTHFTPDNNDFDCVITDDPSPIVIHSPDWGNTVTVPFEINFSNPAGAVTDKVIVDYTELITIDNVTENVTLVVNAEWNVPPGWHTFTIKAYDENGTELGSTSIYLYVIDEYYQPPPGDNSTVYTDPNSTGNSSGSGGSGSSGSSGSSGDSGTSSGSTGSSGTSAGDSSGFSDFTDDVKGWFTEETLNIPRWIWIVVLLGVFLIGHGVRRL